MKVNETKTTVANVWDRQFLGYALLRRRDGAVHLKIAEQRLQKLRHRIRGMTRVTVGKSLEQVACDLRQFIPGWRAYFSLAQTPSAFTELDGWLVG